MSNLMYEAFVSRLIGPSRRPVQDLFEEQGNRMLRDRREPSNIAETPCGSFFENYPAEKVVRVPTGRPHYSSFELNWI